VPAKAATETLATRAAIERFIGFPPR